MQITSAENFTQTRELILHIICNMILHKYVFHDRYEHKLCKIIFIKAVILNEPYFFKIFPHIFFNPCILIIHFV